MSNNKPTNEQIAHDFAIKLAFEECKYIDDKDSDSYIESLIQSYNSLYDRAIKISSKY